MSNYNSGEFSPGSGARHYPNGVAIYSGQLYIIGGGNEGPGNLGQTTVAVPTVSNIQNFPTARWSSIGEIAMQNGAPRVDGRCALVTSMENMYLFGSGGNNNRNGPFASQFTLQGQSGPGWGAAMSLMDSSGNAVCGTVDADVDAKPFGQNGILVGAARVTSNNTNCLYVGYYNTADVSLGAQTWKARWSVYLSPTVLSGLGISVSDTGVSLSLDWFSGSFKGELQYYLGLFATPQGPQQTESVLYLFPMSVDSGGNLTALQTSGSASPAASSWQVPNSTGLAGAVMRDPGGRLNLYYFNASGNQMQVLYLNTWSYTPGAAPAYQAGTRAVTNNNIPPTVLYWIGPAIDNQSPVYEMLFYASDLLAQINSFGTAQILPSFANVSLQSSPYFVLEGFFDGPIPFPNVNSQNYKFQDTLYQAGTVTYGTDGVNEVEHQQSSSWSVGIQTEGSATKGLGPAWDISASGGSSQSSGTETSTTIGQSRSQDSQLDMKSRTISPQGTCFANQIELVYTGYRFTDASGNVVTDPTTGKAGQAPKSFSVSTSYVGGTSRPFLPWPVTPGDLSSYTPEAINARMKSLGYPGSNYFGDVIVENAYAFKSGSKSLEYEWSGSGGKGSQNFEAMSSAFTEHGWSLEASIYAGISGGEGLEIFGAGIAETVSAMAGFSDSTDSSATDTTGQSWGISIDPPWSGPPPAAVPQAIESYTFLIVFLPPPTGSNPAFPANYWTQELLKYGPKVQGQMLDYQHVDPNSVCWRIAYVVTSYSSQDGKTNYSYNGELGHL